MHRSPGCIRQFTAGISVCLLNFFYGISGSWVSPFQDLLGSNKSPVGSLTDSQISWIGSLPALGAIFGALFWNEIINKCGRKKSALINVVPYFAANLIFCFCTSYWLLLAARFLSGLGIVGGMINNTSYLSEISEDRYKGNLGSLLIVFISIGSLFAIVEGSLFSYFYTNLITSILSGLLFILLLFIPESPVHLLRHGKEEAAKKELRWLRNTQNEMVIERELQHLKDCFLQTSQYTRKLSISEVIASPYYLKVMVIGLVIQSGIALTGMGVTACYTQDIVERALGDPSGGGYALLLPAALNCGSLLIIFVCQMFNRKVCLVTCQAICCLSLVMVGVLLVARTYYGIPVPGYIVLSFLCSYFFAQGFGISPLVFVILPEIFSAECRNSFTSILMLEHFSFQFLTTKLYPVFVGQIHLYGWAFIFSGYSAFIAIFCIVYLPESKGRNIQQIFNKLCRTNHNMQTHLTLGDNDGIINKESTDL